MSDFLTDLSRRLNDLEKGTRLRLGVITAVDPEPLSVSLRGAAKSYTHCPRLAGYATPTVGDTVMVLVQHNTLLVLGAVGS